MLEFIKNKKIILLLILIIFCGIKTNVFRNLAEVIIFPHDKRIVNKYGYCSDESIGYLKHLKKKYKISDNPKIINYKHTPQVEWAIINTKNINKNSDKVILLNYPGSEFKVYLTKINNALFELKDLYFLSNKFEKINTIEILNENTNLDNINLKLNIYTINENNNKKIIKTLNVKNLKALLNLSINDIDTKGKLFFEIKNSNLAKSADLDFFLNLKNKYDLKNYQIIEKNNNCYYTK